MARDRIAGVPATAAMMAITAWLLGAAHAAAVEASTYRLAFAPDQARFDPALRIDGIGNSDALARMIDVIRRHARRPGLGFVLAGSVPAGCVSAATCGEADRVRRRAEAAIGTMQQAWPSDAGAFPMMRLSWAPLPGGATERAAIHLLARSSTAPLPGPGCRYTVEVLDPRMPGTLEAPGAAAWLPGHGTEPTSIATGARIRIVTAQAGERDVYAVRRDVDGVLRPVMSGTVAELTRLLFEWGPQLLRETLLLAEGRPERPEIQALFDSQARRASPTPAAKGLSDTVLTWTDDQLVGSTMPDTPVAAAQSCAFTFVAWK
jgi:hypothetical protein